MTSYGSQKIVNLMKRTTHDAVWIKDAVQAAIDLELSTIPPYLCALWSIEEAGTALTTVRAVVHDEMGHLGLMCNLLKGLGVAPKIVSAVPKYPGPLPGGVRPDLTVYLSGMTKEFVEKVMMGIEKPETPIPISRGITDTFPSIGKFYEAIANALSAIKPPLSAAGQLNSAFGVHPLTTIAEAVKAIDHIRGQGEGTTTAATFEGQLAHFYRFEEIFIGKKLVETTPGKLTKTNIDVPFPRTLPMGKVPFGGWTERNPDGKGTLRAFSDLYRSVLQGLEAAWGTGGPSALSRAIGTMTAMEDPAKTLMNVKQPTGTENYGPDFVI
jgi:hypothetical protein